MNSKGFTVTEVIVAMLISTFVIMAAYSMHTFYVKSVSKFLKGSKKEEKQLRFLEFIYNELKEAENVFDIEYSSISYINQGDTLLLSTNDTSITFQRNSEEPKDLFQGIIGTFELISEDTISGFSFVKCTAKTSDTTDHNLQRVITVKKQKLNVSESDWGF